MIRANLLPRRRELVGIAGLEIDMRDVRRIAVGLVVVLAIAAIGIAVDMLRIARLEAAAIDQEALIARDAPRRAELKSIALEVARYQSFAHEALAYRRSGADVAIALAKIGNSVPPRVWLDSLEKQPEGYELAGTASAVDALGATIVALGRALPNGHATLLNIENRERQSQGVRFSARVVEQPPVTATDTRSSARVRRPVAPGERP